MREVILDTPVTEPFIEFLKNFGTVMLLGTMGPGFFKYELKDGFSIKGWIGDTNVEIRFRRNVMDLCEDYISALFYYYHNGKPDLEKLRRMNSKFVDQIQARIHGNADGNYTKG